MGYKDENRKHRLGVDNTKPKYSCPHCKHGMKFGKRPNMVICSKCKKFVEGEDLIINK